MVKRVLSPVSGRSWWAIVAISAVAAFLVAAFASSQLKGSEILPDFREGYQPGAVSIQRGAGYVNRSGEFITAWPPGFSILASPWVVDDARESALRLRFVSGSMAVVWVVFLALIARLVLPRLSIVPVLALAVLWPPMWALGDPMGSEMLFATLSTIAVYLLVRLYRLQLPSTWTAALLTVGAGLALAAAALTRTIGIAVAGAMFLSVALGFRGWSLRRRTTVLILSAVVFFAGLAPWVWVYTEHTGSCGLTSNGMNSVRNGLRRYSGFALGLELKKRSAQWGSYADMWGDVRELSAADPTGALRLVAAKLADPWFATTSRKFDPYLLVIQIPWLALFLLASGRVFWRWRGVPGELVLLHGYVAALWLTASLVEPLLRYLVPGFPFVVIVVLWHAVDAEILRVRETERPESPTQTAFSRDVPDAAR